MLGLPDQIILEAAGAAIVLYGSYRVVEWRIDRFEKDLEAFKSDVWREVGKLREWRHEHEKESSDVRLTFANQISDIRIANAKTDEKFAAIMNILDDIKHRLARLQGDDA